MKPTKRRTRRTYKKPALEFIVKIYRTGKGLPAIFYNQREYIAPVEDPAMERILSKGTQYWWATNKGGVIQFIRPAPEQEW
jgi:hypothetical protein